MDQRGTEATANKIFHNFDGSHCSVTAVMNKVYSVNNLEQLVVLKKKRIFKGLTVMFPPTNHMTEEPAT